MSRSINNFKVKVKVIFEIYFELGGFFLQGINQVNANFNNMIGFIST